MKKPGSEKLSADLLNPHELQTIGLSMCRGQVSSDFGLSVPLYKQLSPLMQARNRIAYRRPAARAIFLLRNIYPDQAPHYCYPAN
jgi:hypothetical protein